MNNIYRDIPGKPSLKPVYGHVILREDGLYDISSRIDMLDEELPEVTELKCTLDIPRANYSVSRKTVYYSS